MPDESTPSPGAARTSTGTSLTTEQTHEITQEMVEKLADKVLALLLDDLKNESERCRLPSSFNEGRHSTFGSAGGW